MIYTDPLFWWDSHDWRRGLWSHLWSDISDQELHDFAQAIGMSREWFQDKNSRFHHYDMRKSFREKAVKNGATEVELRVYILEHLNRKSQYNDTEVQ